MNASLLSEPQIPEELREGASTVGDFFRRRGMKHPIFLEGDPFFAACEDVLSKHHSGDFTNTDPGNFLSQQLALDQWMLCNPNTRGVFSLTLGRNDATPTIGFVAPGDKNDLSSVLRGLLTTLNLEYRNPLEEDVGGGEDVPVVFFAEGMETLGTPTWIVNRIGRQTCCDLQVRHVQLGVIIAGAEMSNDGEIAYRQFISQDKGGYQKAVAQHMRDSGGLLAMLRALDRYTQREFFPRVGAVIHIPRIMAAIKLQKQE